MSVDSHPVSGEPVPGLEALDQVMLRCLAEHGVPGASLAVAKEGRLVYARGFGWADLQALEPVRPTSRFRIASVSKPITGAAVLRLVQEGRLSLDDRAFDLLPVEPYLAPGTRPDPRVAHITLRHLLNHTGGWDRSRSSDPMFMPIEIARALGAAPPAEPDHIIRWIAGRPLDFDPGQAYAYSNFGYCLLGRIIERVTGQTYAGYVQSAILAPLGLSSLEIGATRGSGRRPDEVIYYPVTDLGPSVFQADLGQRVPAHYGAWYLEAMDAHGGWIASAPDLVRFASAFDESNPGPVLTAAGIRAMFAPPPAPVSRDAGGRLNGNYYACGWSVDLPAGGKPGQQHHNGMLPGTAAVLRRRDDGLTWAALFNRALGRKEQYLGAPIVELMETALGALSLDPAMK